jgi:ArsR family transcriptional regulator
MKPRKLKATSKKPSLNGKRIAPARVGTKTIASLTRIFKQLGDESRLTILLALATHREMCVTDLCELLHQTQPAVSHHLTLLRMSGLVGYRRQGKHNFYRIESSGVADVLEMLFADLENAQRVLQFPTFSLAFRPR